MVLDVERSEPQPDHRQTTEEGQDRQARRPVEALVGEDGVGPPAEHDHPDQQQDAAADPQRRSGSGRCPAVHGGSSRLQVSGATASHTRCGRRPATGENRACERPRDGPAHPCRPAAPRRPLRVRSLEGARRSSRRARRARCRPDGHLAPPGAGAGPGGPGPRGAGRALRPARRLRGGARQRRVHRLLGRRHARSRRAPQPAPDLRRVHRQVRHRRRRRTLAGRAVGARARRRAPWPTRSRSPVSTPTRGRTTRPRPA